MVVLLKTGLYLAKESEVAMLTGEDTMLDVPKLAYLCNVTEIFIISFYIFCIYFFWGEIQAIILRYMENDLK